MYSSVFSANKIVQTIKIFQYFFWVFFGRFDFVYLITYSRGCDKSTDSFHKMYLFLNRMVYIKWIENNCSQSAHQIKDFSELEFSLRKYSIDASFQQWLAFFLNICQTASNLL